MVPQLASALGDGDHKVRRNAAEALGKLGVRKLAALALSRLGPAARPATEKLRAVVAELAGEAGGDAGSASARRGVHGLVVRVLLQLGDWERPAKPSADRAAAASVSDDAPRPVGATEAAAPLSAAELTAALRCADATTRKQAAWALGELGEAAGAAAWAR